MRLREHFNIITSGFVQEYGGKDQRKTQTQTPVGTGL